MELSVTEGLAVERQRQASADACPVDATRYARSAGFKWPCVVSRSVMQKVLGENVIDRLLDTEAFAAAAMGIMCRAKVAAAGGLPATFRYPTPAGRVVKIKASVEVRPDAGEMLALVEEGGYEGNRDHQC